MNTKLLRQKVLDLAIHGKLLDKAVVEALETTPGYEPASKLLERIREESLPLASRVSERNSVVSDSERSTPSAGSNAARNACSNPISEDEIPFEIPENWCWCRLGDIGKWQSGTTPNKGIKEYYENGTIPWLVTGDLTDGIISDIPNLVTEKAFNETSLKLNPIGSVCIAMYGGTIGKTGILSIPATTNQACCVCSDFKGIVNKYLFYFLKQHKDIFIQQGFGGAQPNISKEKIISTCLPLPPLEEQKLIVEEIERIFALIDTVEQNKADLETVIKQTKSKILDLAIHGKLVPQDKTDEPASKMLEKLRAKKEEKIANGQLKRDKNDSYIYKSANGKWLERKADGSEEEIEVPFEIPESWSWCRFEEIANVINGKNQSKVVDENGPYPIYGSGGIMGHANDFICPANTTIIGRKGSINNPIYVTEKFWNVDTAFGLVANENISTKYLYFFCKSFDFTKLDNSTTLPSLTKTNIQNIQIPLPPLEEQKLIVAKIEVIFAHLDSITK